MTLTAVVQGEVVLIYADACLVGTVGYKEPLAEGMVHTLVGRGVAVGSAGEQYVSQFFSGGVANYRADDAWLDIPVDAR